MPFVHTIMTYSQEIAMDTLHDDDDIGIFIEWIHSIEIEANLRRQTYISFTLSHRKQKIPNLYAKNNYSNIESNHINARKVC